MRDAKGDVVVYARLESAQSVLRRQNLYAYQRGSPNDLVSGVFLPNDAQVGNSKPSFRDLDPLFRERKDVPSISVLVENNHKRRLQGRMIPFTQISLLHLAVDKIAIRSEARAQIFFQRNEQSLRHTLILLRIHVRTCAEMIEKRGINLPVRSKIIGEVIVLLDRGNRCQTDG